jgi:hypothetical protein
MPFYQTPFSGPNIREEYPPLVVLKTGGVYSVTKYWVEKGELYFLTTQGDEQHVSFELVDRVYPRTREQPR